jgi:hypothetical protein
VDGGERQRNYRTDARGRVDRDGRQDLGLNLFVDFVVNMMRYFCEEKKRIENRIEERKKKRLGRPRGERERNDQCERFLIPSR